MQKEKTVDIVYAKIKKYKKLITDEI